MVDLGFRVSTVARSFPISTFRAVASIGGHHNLKFRFGRFYCDRVARNGCILDTLDRKIGHFGRNRDFWKKLDVLKHGLIFLIQWW